MADNDCSEYYKFFGLRVKELRTKRNWSQQGLAKACKLDKSVISKIENGKRDFTYSTRHKVFDGFEITDYDFHDTPELRAFTGAPAIKFMRQCPLAECKRLCFDV